jgi:predicted porin
MKKSILAIAVASLAASSAALADDPTVYGNIHLSLNQADNDVEGADNNLKVSSNTSAIGVKGSEDLGDGWKAIYKLEFQILAGPGPDTTPDTGFIPGSSISTGVGVGDLTGRDQFVGLKAGFGTVKFGTMSSNYKQMGGKVDPLYRTPFEGRGFLQTQSNLHGGKGINRGRQTHTAQYVSPKFAGVQLVANTTFSGSNDESMGVGVRWSNKNIMVYADWIDSATNPQITCELTTDPATTCSMESAMKVGGKFSADAFEVALQYEDAADRVGADYIFAAGTFNIDKNNQIHLTYGMQDVDEKGGPSADTDGLALAYNHKMSKMTNVYVGYGAKSSDLQNADESMLSAGIRKKF